MIKKTEQHQEVRVKLDVSVTISTKYSAEELEDMLRRACYNFMPNNGKKIYSAEYAEEHALYNCEGGNPFTILVI